MRKIIGGKGLAGGGEDRDDQGKRPKVKTTANELILGISPTTGFVL